jgi:hypothetical protein
VKLLEKLDMRLSESGKYCKRWGLFHCPYCKQKVEKVLADGIKYKSCGCARYSIAAVTSTIPSGNLILILFGRFENAAFHMPFSSGNPFLKISSSHFLASF